MVNYFTFLAQEVREYLAEMGYTSLDDIVGHTELITRERAIPNNEPKYKVLDFSRLLFQEPRECMLHHDKNAFSVIE